MYNKLKQLDMNVFTWIMVNLLRIPKEQRKRFAKLLKQIADLLIHFTIEELQELHDHLEEAMLKDE